MACTFESLSLKGLRLAHLRQLLNYIYNRDDGNDGGWYYGPKDQFEKRHADLIIWLEDAIEHAESEGVRFPK